MMIPSLVMSSAAAAASETMQGARRGQLMTQQPPVRNIGRLCSAGIQHGSVCCAKSCGVCGGAACETHPGGASRCCRLHIQMARRQCATHNDTGCLLVSDVCRDGVPTIADTSSDGTAADRIDGVCCAASCGVCDDKKRCAMRPGGRTACCPGVIRAMGMRCSGANEAVCSFTRWADTLANAVVAWGVYARSCAEVDAFARACVGCTGDPLSHGVALVDEPRPHDT